MAIQKMDWEISLKIKKLTALLLIICMFGSPLAFAGEAGGEIEFRSRLGSMALWLPSLMAIAIVFDPDPSRESRVLAATNWVLSGPIYSSIISIFDQKRFIQKLFLHFKDRPDVTLQKDNGNLLVTYSDGWWFKVTVDLSVVEVKFKKVTPEKWESELKSRAQVDIWDVAASVGLKPPKGRSIFGGSGHLSQDMETTFEGDAFLYRNMLVDFANHAEIASGLLLHDAFDARALRWSKSARSRFVKVIERFDRGGQTSVLDLAVDYQENLRFLKSNAMVPNADKDSAESFRNEIRAIAAQQNAEELSLVMKLFFGRVAFLKKQNKKVDFIDARPTFDPFEQAKAFKIYVEESGLSWSEVAPIIAKRFTKYQIGVDGELIAPRLLDRKFGCLITWLTMPVTTTRSLLGL